MAAARRLLDRVLTQYPRAFDVVAGDSLYARGDWFNFVKARGKDAIAVLKDEQRDLFQDAQGLWTHVPPQRRATARGQREDWDLEGLTTWPQCHHPVRVVRSRETWAVRRQLTKQVEAQVSTWVWVTTLLRLRAGTGAVVQIGHWRWHIENQGFNQLVNTWHADHVYRHQEQAMLVLWLWTLVALNLFAAFWRRNLQPEVRADCSRLHVARQVQAELYADLPLQPRGP